MTYDLKATAKLARVSTGEYPVGFHYSAGGHDYWVETLDQLGLRLGGIGVEDDVVVGDPVLPEDGATVDEGGFDAGTSVPMGIYFYRIEAPGVRDVAKLRIGR